MTDGLTNDYLVKRMLRTFIAVTILVTMAATVSIMINGLVVGNLMGSDGISAYGLANPVLILLSAVSGILANGGTIGCAYYLGRNDTEAVRRNFSSVMIVSVVVGLLYSIVCIALSDPMAGALGASSDIRRATSDYIRGIGFSAVPFLLFNNMILYIRMDGNQHLALVAVGVSVAVDAAVAYGLVAYAGMGLLGIGIALALANLVGLMVTALNFRRGDTMLKVSRCKGLKGELRECVRSGMPTAINRGSQTLKNIILNLLLVSIAGNVAVSALSVQTTIYQVLIGVCTGYGVMTSMMCSMFIGEKDRNAVRDSVRVCMKSGLIACTLVTVAVIAAAPLLVAAFIRNGGDLELSTRCLRLFMLSFPLSVVNLVLLYYYQSSKRYALSNTISIARGVAYVSLFSFALSGTMGTDGVWISFLLAEIFSLLTVLIAVRVYTGKFPRSVDELLLIGGMDSGEICAMSVRNDLDDVMKASAEIERICMSNGVDADTSHRLALCIEELAGNSVRHAFPEGGEHYVMIRIIRTGDGIIFRLRDDGMRFNPLSVESDGLGLKIVRAVAKDIDYRYVMNLNNLTVML